MNYSQKRETLTRKLSILVNSMLSSEYIKRYLILKSIYFNEFSLHRGFVTIFIVENDYDKFYAMVEKCVELLNRNINGLIKNKLVELVFNDIRYNKSNNEFIRTYEHIELCNTYNINNSCMVLIGITSNETDVCSYYVDHIID